MRNVGIRLLTPALAILLPATVAVWPALADDGDRRAARVAVPPLEARARRAGLRLLEGRHLVLATDRPVRPGDGVEELPAVFDQAVVAWCRHYRLEPAAVADWRCFGCLMVDRERFRAAGLLPDWLPPFKNGFCDRNRFWLFDQPNPAYRRHLLLHEGMHAFTLTLRGLATPAWYSEGIAEYLATHRLEADQAGGLTFVPTPIPDRPADVEQLGRIEMLRELRAGGQAPSLAQVLAVAPAEHGSIADYAASWAAVALLANHPTSKDGFKALERGPLGPDFNDRLAGLPGWDASRAGRDFDAFTAEVDYGWDFSRQAIDWSAGEPLGGPRRFSVAADRGWQNVGVTLAAGRRHAFAARGRAGVGGVAAPAGGEVPLESEAEGITLEWYRGRPLGRLLIGQWQAAPADGGRPRFEILAEGSAGEFTAIAAGPLYLKLNAPPGRLATHRGELSVTIEPLGK
jgi:hypothetical protein